MPELFPEVQKSATFSPCRRYRYTLCRSWGEGPAVAFICLNPSTATETLDDPTVRRCIGFAKAWGYGTYWMLNLFAFRATDPRVMKAHAEPIGPNNDEVIRKIVSACDLVVAAWGVHGSHRGRDREVAGMVSGLQCLGKAAGGQPKHPLYLPGNSKLVPWPEGIDA